MLPPLPSTNWRIQSLRPTAQISFFTASTSGVLKSFGLEAGRPAITLLLVGTGIPGDTAASPPPLEEIEARRAGGYRALDALEQGLDGVPYLVGDRYTLADISLYAYTHVAPEGGFDLTGYPSIRSWIERVAAQPGHVLITD